MATEREQALAWELIAEFAEKVATEIAFIPLNGDEVKDEASFRHDIRRNAFFRIGQIVALMPGDAFAAQQTCLGKLVGMITEVSENDEVWLLEKYVREARDAQQSS